MNNVIWQITIINPDRHIQSEIVRSLYWFCAIQILNQAKAWRWTKFKTIYFAFDVLSTSERLWDHRKTYLHVYNFDPLKPQFYVVKLGFTGIYIIFLTGIYIIFLISAQIHRLWVLVRTASPRRVYPQSMFWAEIRKKISDFFLSEKFHFFFFFFFFFFFLR